LNRSTCETPVQCTDKRVSPINDIALKIKLQIRHVKELLGVN